jgi:hypothetical protein
MEHYLYSPEHKREKRRSSLKHSLFLFLGLLFIGGSVYVLKEAPMFHIQSVEVSGPSDLLKEQLLQDIKARFTSNLVQSFLGEDHYFSWPGHVSYASAVYRDVTIDKQFLGRKVIITALPREKYAIWCFGLDEPICYWVDREDGVLIEPAPLSEGQLVFKINDTESPPLRPGDNVLSREQFKNITAFLDFIQEFHIPVSSLTILRSLQEFQATHERGARLMFSYRFKPTITLFESLRSMLSTYNPARIEYIDLTVPTKVYLKERDAH